MRRTGELTILPFTQLLLKRELLPSLNLFLRKGRTPGNFAIDPSGSWLVAANQSSDSLVLFRIDPQTGRLTSTGQSFEVGTPSCVRFLPLN